ncbi:aryl-alcohol dehydrogenase-like predicted oxidoreductase [Thermocatellispora tengchongensis]|uniref:Aryl-alcohol dehydrogenase-like predicted oxidoreductase n=1 Tax=Thermocatellispora tengchongensis TaxID=1073253 RepID=A0A840P0E1_9ACTN|nr:aldo/keto reductase [Thermocatellispora tengchongensis]MBB5131371.1 aryl-alcohol dehydrogenase-like predicted oxidoreductase [Thermocatellispora tengchongensis]
MRYRSLGRTGLRVSELFFGAMTFYEPAGSGRMREYAAMLDAYAAAGGNVIDTASAYGESESILGELLTGKRDRFVVATKYTLSRDPADPNASGNHRKNLTLSLERSLRRLRTDYIDVYWVHIWDRLTPIEETMRALDDAVRTGKILHIGVSNAPAWLVSRANTLAEWRGWTAFAGLQVPYNLLRRDVERELLPMAEAYGMSVAAWGPLAGGVLSGKFSRPEGPGGSTRVDPGSLTARDHAVARAAREVADELGVTAAQVALAWTRSRSAAVHPIIGASGLAQLTENLGAAGLVLPPDAVRRLESATEFEQGYPGDFIAECEAAAGVFGEAVAAENRRIQAVRDTKGDV